MDYLQFFYDSLSIILQAFQEYVPKDYITLLRKKYQLIVNPTKSIYVEIFAYANNTKTKIEQWKFKPKGQVVQSNLQRSYEQENSNDDSELSFSELNQPTFFKTLQNIRRNIQPKLLLKQMQRLKIMCEIKDNQQHLVPFDNGNTFYCQVQEYQNEIFQVKLSFKYNYQDQVVAQQLNEIKIVNKSESDDFELLIDQSYQRKLNINIFPLEDNKDNKENQSTLNIVKQTQRKFSQIIQVSNKNILQTKQERVQSNKIIKSKKQQQIYEIQRLFNNVDFSTIQSSKFKTFIEYLL